ncbi:unnamed protein product [Prorocentrum cordatum]|uniref:Uncharacterized protein n=1 Tax=Prorocentrum cordatum TaxID=2364126 RepID=A0ABN9Q0T1_9DINO|nr:unnamed protein product [Polarella glacialis]
MLGRKRSMPTASPGTSLFTLFRDSWAVSSNGNRSGKATWSSGSAWSPPTSLATRRFALAPSSYRARWKTSPGTPPGEGPRRSIGPGSPPGAA